MLPQWHSTLRDVRSAKGVCKWASPDPASPAVYIFIRALDDLLRILQQLSEFSRAKIIRVIVKIESTRLFHGLHSYRP